MQTELVRALNEGATVITVNQRLARSMHDSYNQMQEQAGKESWPRPDILSFNAWLMRAWTEFQDRFSGQPEDILPLLLNSSQEHALWEEIIEESEEGSRILHISASARTAMEAWDILHSWDLPASGYEATLTEDGRAFMRWVDAFRALCAERSFITFSELSSKAAENVRSGQIRRPQNVWLAGFDEFAPREQRIIDALMEVATPINIVMREDMVSEIIRVSLSDDSEELNRAAQWARHLLDQSTSGGQTIGIVVPDLPGRRTEVERVFSDIMQPVSILPGKTEPVLPFNLSVGLSMNRYPLVRDALRILDFSAGGLLWEEFSQLLLSPFIRGADGEYSRRALLDATIRKAGILQIDRAGLERTLYRKREPQALIQILDVWNRVLAGIPARRRPSRWAHTFSEILHAWGWPGERKLNSMEYQTCREWNEMLSEFSSLDAVVPKEVMSAAIGRLNRMASRRLFQPRSAPAPVQVLGMLEAAGHTFDFLWVTGLSDDVWPEAARPNPFLPIFLQKKHEVPHASAERELIFAKRVTNRLLESAPRVVVSYPATRGDEKLQSSSLIGAVPEVPVSNLQFASDVTYAASLLGSDFEKRVDTTGPPVDDPKSARGGAQLFKLQSDCPFRAFSEIRLACSPLEEPQPGLDARLKGTIIHKVLQHLWEELGDKATLDGLNEDDRRQIAGRVVRVVMRKEMERNPEVLTEAVAKLEERRVTDLVLEWLAVEMHRTAFAVLHTEEARTIELGGLRIDALIDRVDRLEDSSRVYIDYKTGSRVTSNAWDGPRPEEPQIPLYAVSDPHELAAVAFGRVRSGEACFIGLEDRTGIMASRGVREKSLTHQLAEWRAVLETLGESFRSGYAAVDPRNPKVTCMYCHIKPLCRISEIQTTLSSDAEK